MEWRAEGVLLSVRPHGESSAIIEVFTQTRGRHAGVVRGGGGRRMAPVLQPGAQIDVSWRARLEAHIGAFEVEPMRQRAATLMSDRRALLGLSSICAMSVRALPERQPFADLYAATCTLLDALATLDDWPLLYLHWEARLLSELGFGLDLRSCAVTGTQDGLSFVSPRTGRAVSRTGAGIWASRLLPLPACLTPAGGPVTPEALMQGLGITGHFLNHALCPDPDARPLPEARARLVTALSKT